MCVSILFLEGNGQVYNVATGTFDSSKGKYRKTGVFAGETTFPNHLKVEGLVRSLCENLAKNIHQAETPEDIYDVAFDLHFDLVSIHPFADGNGRVSRLMMNYLLLYHGQVPAIIHKEDRKMYINALEESRKAESNGPIREFLYQQQIKEFDRQIEKGQSGNQGQFLTFLA
ncbi:MAG: Fic family protein [Bacteroidota bacterium]|nr:Fic family protein [Bacteroidota bacterium]